MKRAAALLLKILITCALFWILFRHFGFRNILDSVLSADRAWLIIASVVFFISLVFSAVQWNLLLKAQGVNLGFKNAFSLYMIGHFFNNFLPGALGGDIVKVYRIRQDRRRGKEALAATFADRFAGLFILSFFALVCSFYIHNFKNMDIEGNLFLYISLLFGLFIIALFVFFSRRVGAFIYQVLLKHVNPFHLRDKMEELHSFLHVYRNTRRLYTQIFAISFVTQLLRISVHIFASKAVGFNVPPVYFLIFVPLIALIASLPVTFGGLGLREGLGSVLFGYVSADKALAVAAQLMASIVGILVSLVGGVLFVAERRQKEVPPQALPT